MAQLTRSTLKARVGRFFGWLNDNAFPPNIDFDGMADEFGEFLCSYPVGGWNFLQGRIAKLTLVGNQDFIRLPSDFRSVLDILPLGAVQPVMLQGSITDVAKSRSGLVNSVGTYVWCVGHTKPTVQEPYITPILEIGPKPATTQSECLQLVYFGGWRSISGPGDPTIPLPIFMQGLYVRGLTLYIAGSERTANGSLEAVMEKLVGSPLWVAAEHQDGMIQPHAGRADPTVTAHGLVGRPDYPDRLSNRPLELT